ncbi:MAG TPA: hypothetical protein VF519_06015 [Mycobacteriales bacterium]|jgi:uncharacterized delta-60 repeat protein
MRATRLLAAAAALCLLAGSPASAASGGPDGSFGRRGWVDARFAEFDLGVGVTRTADGRTVVAGTGLSRRTPPYGFLARYLPNGRPDPSFGTRGLVRLTFPGGLLVVQLTQLSDGRLLVAGSSLADRPGVVLARFLANGRPDPSFGTRGMTVTSIAGRLAMPYDVTTAPDGATVLVGTAFVDNLRQVPFVKRLLPNGAPDPAFGTDGLVVPAFPAEAIATAVTMLPGGTVAVAGTTSTDTVADVPFLVRFLPNGLQDPTFGSPAMTNLATFGIAALATTPEGLLVAAGVRYEGGVQGGPARATVVRFLPTGTLDLAFGSTGVATVVAGAESGFNAVAVLSQGRIAAAGFALGRTSDLLLARLDALGRPDPAFGRNGVSVQGSTARHEVPFDGAVAADGGTTVAGTYVAPRALPHTFVARFLP